MMRALVQKYLSDRENRRMLTRPILSIEQFCETLHAGLQ